MNSTPAFVEDPFFPAPPDEVAELEALARAIDMTRGFTLLFACCNRASHRDQLMADLRARLSDRRVQFLALREPVPSLLDELRAHLDSPLPDAVFLYAVESWLPSGPEAEESPFILNLNASRNHFPREFSCPLIFWLPQHVLTTLARAAPDFCSVRSGYYTFCSIPEVRDRVAESLTSSDMTQMAGLPYGEKLERANALAAMLAEYEALPLEHRDAGAESRLLKSLATLQYLSGNFKAAERLANRILEIHEASLGPDHPDTAKALNNLALIYKSQGRHAEAEPLLRRTLEIQKVSLGPEHLDTAASLNNLASLYNLQGRHMEAEPLFRRALEIQEASLGPDHPGTATSLTKLASLFESQGRYAEAELLFRRVLAIDEVSLGPDHPNTAASLENLSSFLRDLGRLFEADQMNLRARNSRAAHAHRNATLSENATVK